MKIILILEGVTYKRTVAKEQGPYHESCGLCGPNILVCQRHHFVVPYDKISDVAENHVRCAICQQNSNAPKDTVKLVPDNPKESMMHKLSKNV